MPQLSLAQEETPWALSIIIKADPLRPEAGSVVNVMTHNQHGRVLTDCSRRFVGVAVDFLDTVAEAVTQAYLYGNTINDPGKVLRRLAREAAVHAELHAGGSR